MHSELSEHSESKDPQGPPPHPSHNHRRDPIPSDQTVVGSNPAGGAYIWGFILDKPPHIAINGKVTKHFSAILAPLMSSEDYSL